jgi:hypothetical protein
MEEGDGIGTFTDETWAIWEPLIEAVRPRSKTPLTGPSSTMGATLPVSRNPAMNVVVFQ